MKILTTAVYMANLPHWLSPIKEKLYFPISI